MKWRISLLLILALSLVLCACSINLPGISAASPAEIHRNQLIIGRDFALAPGGLIEGDIVAIAADITITSGSMVKGNILILGSSLENKGIIKGDLSLLAGSAYLRNGSILNGDVNQLFNHVIIENKAQVTGEINTITFPGAPSEGIGNLVALVSERLNPQNWLMMDIVRIILTSLLALLAGVFLKRRMAVMVQQVRLQPFISWGAGLLTLGLIPIISILLVITICLSPLGLMMLLALVLTYLLGWIILGITSGNLLQLWLHTKWPLELQAFIGSLVLGILTMLIGRLPCLGWTINILVGCIGLGAILITRFGGQIDVLSSEKDTKK
jgi:hypothetical protein